MSVVVPRYRVLLVLIVIALSFVWTSCRDEDWSPVTGAGYVDTSEGTRTSWEAYRVGDIPISSVEVEAEIREGVSLHIGCQSNDSEPFAFLWFSGHDLSGVTFPAGVMILESDHPEGGVFEEWPGTVGDADLGIFSLQSPNPSRLIQVATGKKALHIDLHLGSREVWMTYYFDVEQMTNTPVQENIERCGSYD